MHISFIYFFPLILSNALAGSGLLQSAPHSYPFRVSLGQSLCPSQKDPRDDFQILHQDMNIYELQCERSHLFSSPLTCTFASQSIFNRHRLFFSCAQFWLVLRDIKNHLAEKRAATELLWVGGNAGTSSPEYCDPKSMRESIASI